MLPDEIRAMAAKEREARSATDAQIHVCVASACRSMQSEDIRKALDQAVKEQGLSPNECRVKQVGCLGLCGNGPLVKMMPSGELYQHVQPSDAGEIVDSLGGHHVERIHLDQKE